MREFLMSLLVCTYTASRLPCFVFICGAPAVAGVPFSPLAKIMERMQESLFDLLGVEGIEMDPVAKVSIVRDVCEVKMGKFARLALYTVLLVIFVCLC